MIREEISLLTFARFVAAAWVFAFHIHIRWPISCGKFLENILSQGAVGMSMFFVLSGFILVYNYYGALPNKLEFKTFILKRLARIYPVYALVGILTAVLFPLKANFLAGTLIVLTDVVLLQGWFPALFNHLNNDATWSLSVEFFCYCMFPALLGLLGKMPYRSLFAVSFVCYFLSVLPGWLYNFVDPKPSLAEVYILPIYRLFEFILGMIAGLIFLKKELPKVNLCWTIALVLVMVCYLGFVGARLGGYIGHNFIIIPCMALLMYSVAGSKVVLAKPFIFCGQISYSFYLIQSIPITLFKAHLNQFKSVMPLLQNVYILGTVLFLVVTIFAALTYYFLEKPARKWLVTKFC
jgi:peptidoglycan/LPS O-acetylase OafA/YrhL